MAAIDARSLRFAAAVVVVVGILVAIGLRKGSGTAASPAASQRLRPAIDEVIGRETQGLDTPAQVDAYLDRLEARARKQNEVTALEIEPGFAAIARLQSKLGATQLQQKQAQFNGRMLRLQSELRSRNVR